MSKPSPACPSSSRASTRSGPSRSSSPVLASPWTAEVVVVDDGSTDGTRDVLASRRPDRRAGAATSPRTGARAPRCGAGSPRPPPTSSSCRTPTSSTTRPSTRGWSSRSRGRRRRRVRLAVHRQRAAPGALLLALGRQPVPDHAVQHVHQPEPHRHGDLLQGLPARGHPVASPSRRTASASSRRSPPRWPARRGGSTRCRSATPAAPTRRARRSAGATACGVWSIRGPGGAGGGGGRCAGPAAGRRRAAAAGGRPRPPPAPGAAPRAPGRPGGGCQRPAVRGAGGVPRGRRGPHPRPRRPGHRRRGHHRARRRLGRREVHDLRLLDRLEVPTSGEVRFRGRRLADLRPALGGGRGWCSSGRRPSPARCATTCTWRTRTPTRRRWSPRCTPPGSTPGSWTGRPTTCRAARPSACAWHAGTEPEVLLMDEPTSALDPEARRSLERTADRLADEGRDSRVGDPRPRPGRPARLKKARSSVLVGGRIARRGHRARFLADELSADAVWDAGGDRGTEVTTMDDVAIGWGGLAPRRSPSWPWPSGCRCGRACGSSATCFGRQRALRPAPGRGVRPAVHRRRRHAGGLRLGLGRRDAGGVGARRPPAGPRGARHHLADAGGHVGVRAAQPVRGVRAGRLSLGGEGDRADRRDDDRQLDRQHWSHPGASWASCRPAPRGRGPARPRPAVAEASKPFVRSALRTALTSRSRPPRRSAWCSCPER